MGTSWRSASVSVLALCGMLWLGGCAKAVVDPANSSSCTSTDQCPVGQECNPVTRVCTNPNVVPDTTPDTSRDETRDVPRDDPPDTTDPNACDPACGLNQECVNGQCMTAAPVCDPGCKPSEMCVNGTCVFEETGTCDPECPQTQVCDNGTCKPAVCDPGCAAGGTCTRDGCIYPSCTSEGARCTPSTTRQGAFWCLTNTVENVARCYSDCDNPGTPSTCKDAQYCLGVDDGPPVINACIDSQCNLDIDCDNGAIKGTCLARDNNYSTCLRAGTVQVGGTCEVGNNALLCVPGSVCRSGVCRELCDPWAPVSDCGPNQACNIFSTRAGVCVDNVDPTGDAPYTSCTTPGNYCDDAVGCFGAASPGRCLKYCRASSTDLGSDCDSLPDSVCDNYIVPNDRSYGICFGSCTNDPSSCPTGTVCDSMGRCRTTCTQASVVQDCCSGQSPCDWTCQNGFCE